MDFNAIFYELESSGFIVYFITFLLIFTAVYYLFLTVPLFEKDEKRKKVALILSFAVALIFVRNRNFIEAVHRTIQDFSYVIVMTVLIALIVTSILYIGEKYSK